MALLKQIHWHEKLSKMSIKWKFHGWKISAAAGVGQWIECRPVNQSVGDLIPSQGICLGCGSGPQ